VEKLIPMRAAVFGFVLALAMAGPVIAAAQVGVFISPSGEPFWPTAAAPDGFDAWFARVAGKDGRIDRAAFRADATQFFHHLDADGDGVIDGFEIAAYEKSVAAVLDIDGQGFASRRGDTIKASSLLDDPEPVSSADTALNSHITLAEWLAAADHRFDILDDKHRGWLDHDGLRAKLPDWARKP
jgi:hypothetical protein